MITAPAQSRFATVVDAVDYIPNQFFEIPRRGGDDDRKQETSEEENMHFSLSHLGEIL